MLLKTLFSIFNRLLKLDSLRTAKRPEIPFCHKDPSLDREIAKLRVQLLLPIINELKILSIRDNPERKSYSPVTQSVPFIHMHKDVR